MTKNIIHLNMKDLKRIVNESVRSIMLVESYSSYDVNEIGSIEFSCDFDEEAYEEWLQDEGLENNPDNLKRYYMENVEYELELTDSESYHHMDWQNMYYEDICDEYSQGIADEIMDTCMRKGKGSLEPMLYMSEKIDINNPEELNAEAMKLLRHGRYFDGVRGYILSNGVVIYTEAEHNMVTRIEGIKNTFHFIGLGNIRVLPNSFDMAKKPTDAQLRVLMKLVQSCAGGSLYADYHTPNGDVPRQYNNPNCEMVMRDIKRIYG